MVDSPHDPPLTQIPRDISDFTGRDAEQAAIVALARESPARGQAPAVVVHGPAGIGKSALTVRVAHRLAGDFPDGQLYVDLRGGQSAQQDPADVLYALLTNLGLDRSAIPDGLSARAGLYRASLSRRRVVVVLDNASSVAQLDPLLPGSSPSCLVLVTSRSGLHELAGAERFRLGLLPADVSVDLLRRVVGAERVDAEPAAARELAELCGRLPLALRIAGARLAARPHWTLRKAADRLSDEYRRLDELRVGDLAVAASFELSHELQSPISRRLFALYSMLPPTPFYAATGALLAGSHPVRAEEATELLAEARLVEVAGIGATGEPRFVFHDLLRLYARRLLAELPPTDTWDALVRLAEGWAAHLADGADVAWVEEHAEALLFVLEQLRDGRAWRLLGDLAQAVVPFLEVRARWAEWKRVAALAVTAAAERNDPAAEARTRRSLARVSRESGDWAGAIEQFEASIALCERLGDRRALADALRGLGAVRRYRGEHAEAEAAFRRSLALCERLGDVAGRAAAHRNLGLLMRDLREPAAAERHGREALALFRAAGDRRGEAATLRNLGILLTARGDHAAAEDAYRDALRLFRAMADPRGRGVHPAQPRRLPARAGRPRGRGGALHGRPRAVPRPRRPALAGRHLAQLRRLPRRPRRRRRRADELRGGVGRLPGPGRRTQAAGDRAVDVTRPERGPAGGTRCPAQWGVRCGASRGPGHRPERRRQVHVVAQLPGRAVACPVAGAAARQGDDPRAAGARRTARVPARDAGDLRGAAPA